MSLAARLALAMMAVTTGCGGVGVGLLRLHVHRLRTAAELPQFRDWTDHCLLLSWAGLIVFNTGIAWLLARRWSRSIKRLAEAAERVSTGELERQAQALLTLHRVSATASRSLRQEEILEAVLDEILERFQLRAGWVCTDDETSGTLELRAHRGLSAAFVAAQQAAPGPCICAEAQSRQAAARPSERPHCARLLSPELLREGLRSHVCVPLVAKSRVRGILHLASDVPNRFEQENLAVLTALGQQIGVALENAQMFAQAQREAAQFSALFEISKALISSHRLPEILQLITDKAAEVMGSDFCALLLLEAETQRLRVQAVHGANCHCQGGHPLHRCEALAYQAVQQQNPQIIEDFTDYSRSAAGFQTPCTRLAYLISVPLQVVDHPIGALNVGAAMPRRFTPHDMALLELFSHLASIAIENARLVITSVLIPEVHHRVKNNLQDIASLLSLQLRRLQSPEAQMALHDTIRRIKGLALVHDLMSHSSPERIDLTALIQEIKTQMLQALILPEQTLVIEVEGSSLKLPSRLVQAAALVLNELASNALKHAFRDRQQGYLRMAVSERDGQVELQVQDDGPGLPPEVLAGQHRGLGLTIVETLVQRDLNGHIEWSNNPGATVRVTFPKSPPVPWQELGLP